MHARRAPLEYIKLADVTKCGVRIVTPRFRGEQVLSKMGRSITPTFLNGVMTLTDLTETAVYHYWKDKIIVTTAVRRSTISSVTPHWYHYRTWTAPSLGSCIN